MSTSPHTDVLVPGLATGIGSLPLEDPHEAAALSLRVHGRLPATPQLPIPREGVVAQWAGALPEVTIERDGAITIDRARGTEPVRAVFGDSHVGLLTFLDDAAEAPDGVARIKTQMVGPLTLGVALTRAGMPIPVAFERAAEAVRAWAPALERLLAERLPSAAPLVFLDEPALVLWTRDEAPIEREEAVDVLSGALAAFTATTGVHVCGDGDVKLAFEAGPRVLGLPACDGLLVEPDVLVRHIDADGWVAWGAVPTDRPLGEAADSLWRHLVAVWCELTRRGCDPVRLRTHGVVTPACGLATHGASQAERALRLARDIACRVGDQAVAARLTVGA